MVFFSIDNIARKRGFFRQDLHQFRPVKAAEEQALNFRRADLIGIENIQQNQLGIGLRNSGKRMLRAQKLIQVALIEIMLHRAFNQLMGSQPLARNGRAVQHLLLVQQHGQLLQGIVI